MGDRRLCYRTSVPHLTVVEASGMNTSDAARATGEGFFVTIQLLLRKLVISVQRVSA